MYAGTVQIPICPFTVTGVYAGIIPLTMGTNMCLATILSVRYRNFLITGQAQETVVLLVFSCPLCNGTLNLFCQEPLEQLLWINTFCHNSA